MIMIIIQIIVFLAFVFVGLVVFLQKILKSDAQGAIRRMEVIYQDLLNKQKDLTQKIEAAEKEYQEKKEAAMHVAEKIKSEAMDEMRDKRDETVKVAKTQADEILGKARASAEEFHKKIELELSRKMIDQAAALLIASLTPEASSVLHGVILKEFLAKGKDFDLSGVGSSISKMVIKTAFPLSKDTVDQLSGIIRVKLNRTLEIEEIEDRTLGAGVMLQFDTLMLDGSLASFLKESADKAKREVEFQK